MSKSPELLVSLVTEPNFPIVEDILVTGVRSPALLLGIAAFSKPCSYLLFLC